MAEVTIASKNIRITWTRGKQLTLLSVVLVVYLLVGAVIFQSLESQSETDQKVTYKRLLREFFNSSNLTMSQIEVFADSVRRLSTTASVSDVQNWDFPSSFFFTLTVVTTIGYGQISPVTGGGQAFCCVYALLGIPLTGLLLVRLSSAQKDVFNALRDRITHRFPNNYIFSKASAPVYMATIGVLLFILIPAVLLHRSENWTILESMYYAFITLSTIGFGDYVPGQTAAQYGGRYRLLLMLWIFLGLAFLGLILDILNDVLSKTAPEMKPARAPAERQDDKSTVGSQDVDDATELDT